MLLLAHPADPVLDTLLHLALTRLGACCESPPPPLCWSTALPLTAAWLPPEQTPALLRQLHRAHLHPAHSHRLTDYHLILLYEAVRFLARTRVPGTPLGDYHITTLRLAHLATLFFGWPATVSHFYLTLDGLPVRPPEPDDLRLSTGAPRPAPVPALPEATLRRLASHAYPVPGIHPPHPLPGALTVFDLRALSPTATPEETPV